ncbi:MAG: divalent metal cation transporter, partial [Rhodopirellula sp.]|nr:divalent metal cation transporter [Rhodopirellula sp.]
MVILRDATGDAPAICSNIPLDLHPIDEPSMSDIAPSSATSVSRPWYQRIGPGLITACVVIGPGSIMTSSKTGATYGYSLSWIVVIAVVFMLVYTALGAKIGVVSQRSMGDLVRERAGRPLAILIGFGVFFIAAAFQFGNNLGVHSAVEQLSGLGADAQASAEHAASWTKFAPVVLFNVLSIAFVFFAKNL